MVWVEAETSRSVGGTAEESIYLWSAGYPWVQLNVGNDEVPEPVNTGLLGIGGKNLGSPCFTNEKEDTDLSCCFRVVSPIFS